MFSAKAGLGLIRGQEAGGRQEVPLEKSGHTCTAVPLGGGAGVCAECEGSEAGLHTQCMGGGWPGG